MVSLRVIALRKVCELFATFLFAFGGTVAGLDVQTHALKEHAGRYGRQIALLAIVILTGVLV